MTRPNLFPRSQMTVPDSRAEAAGAGKTRRRAKTPPARQSLSVRAYETLKWKILCMELESGRLYAERDLCELIGLGRAPVSHAVLRLSEDRLIDVIPRRGILIRSWSAEMIDKLMEARLALEVEVAGLAAERASSEDLDRLEALLDDGARYVEAADREALARVDRDFHVGLARAARNDVLVELVEHLHERSLMLWFVNLSGREQFSAAQAQHRVVLAALQCRNPEAARHAMRSHLDALRGSLPHWRPAAGQAAALRAKAA